MTELGKVYSELFVDTLNHSLCALAWSQMKLLSDGKIPWGYACNNHKNLWRPPHKPHVPVHPECPYCECEEE